MMEQIGSPFSIMTLGRGISLTSLKAFKSGTIERFGANKISLTQKTEGFFTIVGRIPSIQAFIWVSTMFIPRTRSTHSRVP